MTTRRHELEHELALHQSGGSLFLLLAFIFVILKVCGIVQWSWLWVFSPLWIVPAIFVVSIIVCATILVIIVAVALIYLLLLIALE